MRSAFSRLPGFQELISGWETSDEAPAEMVRLGKLMSTKYDIGAARWTTVFADHTVDDLILSNGDYHSMIYLQEIERRILELRRSMDHYSASLAGDLLFWLPDDLLMKVDRMTMAHSVEARAPYLAPDLMLKALALPPDQKLRGKNGKFLLRKLVESHFPGPVGQSLAWRKKHGFEVPVSSWLRNQLRELVEDRLSTTKLAKSGFLDMTLATKVKEKFFSSPTDTPLRRKLWALLCFQTWLEWHEAGFGFR